MQLPPKASQHRNSLVLYGQNVFVKIFSWNKYCKAIQTGFVPGDVDTNSFRTGAATPAVLLRLPADRIKGARKWHCDLM